MGRVKVRDQYGADHWIEASALAYAPWRDYQVIDREDDTTAEAGPPSPPEAPSQGDGPAVSARPDEAEGPRPSVPASSSPPGTPAVEPATEDRPAKLRKPAAE